MDYPLWVVHFSLRCRGRIWFYDRANFSGRLVAGSQSGERKLVLARVPFGAEEGFSPMIPAPVTKFIQQIEIRFKQISILLAPLQNGSSPDRSFAIMMQWKLSASF